MATASSPFSSFLNPQQGFPLAPGQTPPPAGAGSPTLPASFGGPTPAGQTPPPSVNPQIVYTDLSGKGYDPAALAAAWGNGSTAFAQDPANARVRDILPQYGTVLNAPAVSAAPAASSPGISAPGVAAGGLFGGPTGINDPRASAFFDLLQSNIDKTPQVDPNDPTIKAETDAFAAQQERARRSGLSQLAEKGGDNANLDAYSRSLIESGGQATGAFQAGLMDQERQARRAQIQNMLSLGGSFLTAEQQLALSKELNDMNLAESAYQFDTNTALATSPFAAGATA